jgi:iron complex outermembrane receptor protein
MKKSRTTPRRLQPALLGALLVAGSSLAAEPVFELGTILVTGSGPQVGEIGEDQVSSVITRQDMKRFNRDNVGDAVNLLTGVTISTNSRNEKTVSLRGFDARQAPLFIDGIPVYVPYDGYVDFNRFTTADLAAIQVAKGFSSVVYGANTLGGAINLISRKPTAVLEGDASVSFASGNERQTSVNVGTNQGMWYLQAGASYLESDNFPLSSDFKATATENGGSRENSYRKDSKVSLKLGLTPNSSDEYAISYYKQDGVKGQPPSTDPAAARYWQWPYWNKESFYFVSKTALGLHETLKARLYQDQFDNSIKGFTNSTYSVLKTSGAGSVSSDGVSIYDDETVGGSLELESTRLGPHTLRLVTHYKEDKHLSHEASGLVVEQFKDTLMSYAAEDNIQLASRLMLSLGLAHHELRPDTLFSRGNAYSLPGKKSADNGQAGLFYDYSDTTRFYATLAQKTRLPTLKDRYSARLGTFIENPNLRPEASVNYEIGYQGAPWPGAKAEAAVFYSDISDKIQSVFVGAIGSSCAATTKCQMQNVGKVQSSGLELGLKSAVNSWLELGANFTYIYLKNVSSPNTKITDVPREKLTLQAVMRPKAQVEVVAFVESNSERWASDTVRLGGFTTLNLKAVYRPTRSLSTEVGVTNLADKNYSLADGFPNPGRMVFANACYLF